MLHSTAVAPEPQSTTAVLMVRPANFAFNPETADSNAFQFHAAACSDLPLREFDRASEALARAGIEVLVAQDSVVPAKPDAVFPNNWVSFHRDGSVVLYPMLAPNRRVERRADLVQEVIRKGAFGTSRTIDLSYRENQEKYLEGTGSLVLDRVNHVAYAGLSPRTHLDVLGEFAQQLDYELVTFEAADGHARAIYHTNVLISIGTRFAVMCGEVIHNPLHRRAVFDRLQASGREIVEITESQLHSFAGNMLELAPPKGRVIALSTTAWGSLTPIQHRTLERHGTPLALEVPTIERVGGGGVRCMLAEIHLPKRSAGVMS